MAESRSFVPSPDTNERSILISWTGNLLDVGEGSKACPEIVEGDPHTRAVQAVEHGVHPSHLVSEKDGLGHLGHDPRGRYAKALEDLEDVGREVDPAREFRGGQIESDGAAIHARVQPGAHVLRDPRPHGAPKPDREVVIVEGRRKGLGPEQPALGMLPAGERLETDDIGGKRDRP